MEIRNSQSKSEKITSRIAYTFGAFGNDVFYAAMSTYLINLLHLICLIQGIKR